MNSLNRPKIVILTAGGMNGRRLARLLWLNQIDCTVVTIAYPLPKRRKLSLSKYLLRYMKRWLASIRILRRIKMSSLPSYPERVLYAGLQNSGRLIRTLKKLAPSYILMMGGGILSDEVIEIAKHGVLNAHPGILPYIRGIDCIPHAILRNRSIGVSGHFIDAGIDTGKIIDRYFLPCNTEDTLASLSRRMDHLSVALMMSMAKRIWNGDTLPGFRQSKKFPLCKKISLADLHTVHKQIEAGTFLEQQLISDDYGKVNDGSDLMTLYKQWWKDSPTF